MFPVETLEARRLMSVSLSNGLLRISGSERNDKLTVSVNRADAGTLDVKLNNVVTQYKLSDVTGVRIDGRGGDDRIDVNQSNGAIRLSSRIYGGDGDDTILGGNGRDRIIAGAGDDSVFSGNGNDSVYGEAGDDSILGGNGRDYLRGDVGDDSIVGNKGDDRCFGDDGDDRLTGDDGDDSVMGGAGQDHTHGGRGRDHFEDDANDVLDDHGNDDDPLHDVGDDHGGDTGGHGNDDGPGHT